MTSSNASMEISDEVAYVYDDSLEGLLSSIFEAYILHEDPSDIYRSSDVRQRLFQRLHSVRTDLHRAERVREGLIAKGGLSAYNAVRKASASSHPDASTYAYRFVRYAMDVHEGSLRPFSNISHPSVQPLVAICRAIDSECEKMRQFIRFRHLKDETADFWYAKCNPRDSVIPFVMDHFVERFNVQPFLIYDEVHELSGIYDGRSWYLVDNKEMPFDQSTLPGSAANNIEIEQAWKTFYRSVSIDARYNPELRRSLMPKRLWKNLTELQEDAEGLLRV